jgi:hypothetical protein
LHGVMQMKKNVIIYELLIFIIIGTVHSADRSETDAANLPVDINLKVYSNNFSILNDSNNIMCFEIENIATKNKSIAHDISIKLKLSKYIALDKMENTEKYFVLPRRGPAKMKMDQDGIFEIYCSSLEPHEYIMFNYSIRPVLENVIGNSINDNCSYVLSKYWSIFGKLREDIKPINIIKNDSISTKENDADSNSPPFDKRLFLLISMLAVALCIYFFVKWKR